MNNESSQKLCECGCGQPAPIAKTTVRARGWTKGQPKRFIRGHARPRPITSAYYIVTDTGHETPCWVWKGVKRGNRGLKKIRGADVYAYRAMYEQEVGPIPEEYLLHHLCGVPECVRPDHLEVLTRSDHFVRHGLHRIPRRKGPGTKGGALGWPEH